MNHFDICKKCNNGNVLFDARKSYILFYMCPKSKNALVINLKEFKNYYNVIEEPDKIFHKKSKRLKRKDFPVICKVKDYFISSKLNYFKPYELEGCSCYFEHLIVKS